MKLLLTDIDGVLLNWSQGFIDFHNRSHNGDWIKFDQHEFEQFFNSPAFGDLSPIGDAQEYISKFKSDGWTIVAISAAPMDSHLVAARKDNLIKHFGNVFSGVFHVDSHTGSKEHALRAFSPGIWVEDHVMNAKLGAELGHRTFLYTTQWNKNESSDLVTRVHSWKEIYEASNE